MERADGRVTVPDLVGLEIGRARDAGHEAAVVVVADVDGPPLGALTWPGRWLVTGQRPVAGSRVPRWDVVQIVFRRADGDEAGDREPRLPAPGPDRSDARATRDET